MSQEDLAQKSHWDNIYNDLKVPTYSNWHPSNYDSLALEHMLFTEIKRCRPQTVLEIGCGNSVWLPYLSRAANVRVSGIDYSEKGCELARRRLKLEGINGDIFCEDIFGIGPDDVGQYDLVFSLGVVEHFADLDRVLSKLMEFVKPGGVLLTEVPNLYFSIHGFLSWVWQPELLKKHELISRDRLIDAYSRAGAKNIRGYYLGILSLNIVAWEIYQRWPRLCSSLVPVIRKISSALDSGLVKMNKFDGARTLAPFIYVVGEKPF